MKAKLLVLLCFTILSITMVNGQSFVRFEGLFDKVERSNTRSASNIQGVETLNVDMTNLNTIFIQKNHHIALQIPYGDEITFKLDLSRKDIFSEGFQVVNENGEKADITAGLHYQGIVNGDPNSLVAVSVFENEISGVISYKKGNFNFGKMKDSEEYAIYPDRILNEKLKRYCALDDALFKGEIEHYDETKSGGRGASKFVKIHIEVDDDMVTAFGGVQAVTNYVTALFNQSNALYARDDIDARISEIKCWTTVSPYIVDPDEEYKSFAYLELFQQYTDNFNGDLSHLITMKDIGGGVAAGFQGLCNADPDESKCVSGLNGFFENIPTFSWDVQVVTHEQGHLMGSPHTHACVWNGNNTQIDGCSGYIELGNCPLLGIPNQGGTIMSYCHQTDVGINMSLGFGTQPKNLIQQTINNSECLEGSGGGSSFAVSPTVLQFKPTSECKTITITSDEPWRILLDADQPADFLSSVNPASGNGSGSSEVCVSNNPFPVTLGGYIWVVTQSQSNAVPVLVIQDSIYEPLAMFYPENQIIIPFGGGFYNSYILTNTDWRLVMNEYDKKWITIRSSTSGNNNDVFELQVAKNNYPVNRYATISLIYNNNLDTTYFTVSQPSENSGYLNVPAELSSPSYEYSDAFNLYSDLEWELDEANKPAWVTFSPVKGRGDQIVTVTFAENSAGNNRTGNAKFIAKLPEGGTIEKDITLSQFRSAEGIYSFSAFPNPAKDRLAVQFPVSGRKTLDMKIVDPTGKVVMILERGRHISDSFNEVYSVKNLTPGVYVIQVQMGDEYLSRKLFIID